MQNIKVLVPANLAFSSGIRDIATEAAALADFEKKQINMFRLIVDEIFMNAIRYGSNKESQVMFEVAIDENRLICAIEDEGKGEKKITADELKSTIQEQKDNVSLHKGHGRGLAQITSTLVQAFEVLDKPDGGLRIEFLIEKQKMEVQSQKPETIIEKKILPEKTIKLSGAIDYNTLAQIKEEVETVLDQHSNEAFRLIYDCADLDYVNSSVLGQFAAWQAQLEKQGGETVIKNPSENFYEILDLVGLTKIFIVEDEKAKGLVEKKIATSETPFESVD